MADERARLQAVQAKHLDRLLAWPNVTAVDINKRSVGGKETEKLCLVVWVRSKKPKSELAEKEVLPKEIDGVPVDVYEGEATLGEGFRWPPSLSAEDETSSEGDVPDPAKQERLNLRPLDTLRGGDSLAPNNADYAGTLGYFVKKNSAVGILSNSHVMGSVGNKLISPAKMDGGDPTDDYIGTVESSVVTTDVDCGYAPLRGEMTNFKLKDGTSVTGTEIAQVGTFIKFYGRTSGSVKSGAVVSVNWSGTIDGKQFRNQILISQTVQGGDSGSLLLNKDNDKAIGLIFAGSTTQGLANPIGDVLDALGVTIAI